MAPSHFISSAPPLSGRYLAFTDREQIALWRAQGYGVRAIALRLARAPSTISRELRRNAATRAGGFEYRATTAQWKEGPTHPRAGQHVRVSRPPGGVPTTVPTANTITLRAAAVSRNIVYIYIAR